MPFTITDAEQIALEHYALPATATPLPGELDTNFLLTASDGARYILKIAHPSRTPELLDLENQMMAHLDGHRTPRVLPSQTGEWTTTLAGGAFVRLLTYLPGEVFARVPHTPALLRNFGTFLGELDHDLQDFTHPAMKRELVWDLTRAEEVISQHLTPHPQPFSPREKGVLSPSPAGRGVRGEGLGFVAKPPLPPELIQRIRELRKNATDAEKLLWEFLRGRRLHETKFRRQHPIDGYILDFYCHEAKLAIELDGGGHAEPKQQLHDLARTRHLETKGIKVLRFWNHEMLKKTHEVMEEIWYQLGERLSPHPQPFSHGEKGVLSPSPTGRGVRGEGLGPAQSALLSYFLPRISRLTFSHLPWQVIHNDANDYNLLAENGQISGLLDFGDALYNPRICELAIAIAYAILDKDDPLTAAALITEGYHAANPLTEDEIAVLWDLIGARLAVSVTMSTHRAVAEPENEYHQISAAPAWKTLAQLAEIDPDFAYFTLRRACGLNPIPQAALSAWFRTHPEDFAALAQTLAPAPALSRAETESIRHEQIGFNLSLSYQKHLHIVRGWKQYLYDPDGREYLDCVNNVCHVGHSHPRVVAALASQAAILNTNTRYYHPNIALLAERLTATMPEGLDVCFFVNSGSEANDLALRLARAYTGRKDMVVLEGAYHGNVISAVDISPYKFDGAGGQGAPDWVHPLPLPCAYRGRLRVEAWGTRGVGEVFVEEADAVIHEITQSPNHPIAGYISESIIGTGGQVVFPEGYLAGVYARVRNAGGVCIADEVQHGFGRVGTHFWGFEQHGVIPDIVTMGKPFGNGHPLAAVVTTREIARAFHNGMEYFNTFGGSPVSCAVGLAVMAVIEEEGLQTHALEVGDFWKAGMEELMGHHALIGDVRGSGLFLGMELVRDRETLEPAAAEASEIVEQMKDRGILLSTDGPLHNIIKIKPPMVITKADVERILSTMDGVLAKL